MNAFNIPERDIPRLIVVGGGFAGINLINHLLSGLFQIVLLDKNNYHTFQPLLYQVATAGLEPDSIAYPLRKIFKNKSFFHFRVADVDHVDIKAQLIHTDKGPLRYDYLVWATGTSTNFFGNSQIKNMGMGMKTVPEALNLRSLILQNFEEALFTNDIQAREALMNVAIVGGGPTGVELAGALAELKNIVLPKDYPDLDIRQMNIHLIEASPRLLASLSEKSSQRAYDDLKLLGVNVWLSTKVIEFDGYVVQTDKNRIATRTLVWAAGVAGNLLKGVPAEVVSRGRFLVDQYNKIQGFDNLFALGDVALMPTKDYPNGHPMVAQPAIQQGKQLAKNLVKMKKGKSMKPFVYKDLGSMATIGRNRAVAEISGLKMKGLTAWFVWMVVHLLSLVGFRNRLVALTNWIIGYFTYDKSIRLIIRPWKRKSIEVIEELEEV